MNMSTNATTKSDDCSLSRHRLGKEVCIALSVLSFSLNATFLFVLVRNKDLTKRRRITYHIANLALADTWVGLSTFCYFLVEISKEASMNTLRQVLFAIAWGTVFVSFSAMCLMAIERVAVITTPLRWKEIFTLKRVILVMLGIWLSGTVSAVITYFYPREMALVLSLFYLLPVCLTSAGYIFIYCRFTVHSKHKLHGKSLKLQQKTSSLVLVLVLVLTITVLPYMIWNQIQMICRCFHTECDSSQFPDISDYLYVVEMLNFVANPLIYIWSVRLYRKAFWRMFTTDKI